LYKKQSSKAAVAFLYFGLLKNGISRYPQHFLVPNTPFRFLIYDKRVSSAHVYKTKFEEEIKMALQVSDFDFTLDSLFGANAQFQLKKVSEWREFGEGNQNEDKKLLGYKYQVANLDLVVKFTVKVESPTPVVSNDEVQKSPNPIYISFTNSRAVFYGKSLYDCDISVTAEKAIIKQKQA